MRRDHQVQMFVRHDQLRGRLETVGLAHPAPTVALVDPLALAQPRGHELAGHDFGGDVEIGPEKLLRRSVARLRDEDLGRVGQPAGQIPVLAAAFGDVFVRFARRHLRHRSLEIGGVEDMLIERLGVIARRPPGHVDGRVQDRPLVALAQARREPRPADRAPSGGVRAGGRREIERLQETHARYLRRAWPALDSRIASNRARRDLRIRDRRT
jgi:hypothetical protein